MMAPATAAHPKPMHGEEHTKQDDPEAIVLQELNHRRALRLANISGGRLDQSEDLSLSEPQ